MKSHTDIEAAVQCYAVFCCPVTCDCGDRVAPESESESFLGYIPEPEPEVVPEVEAGPVSTGGCLRGLKGVLGTQPSRICVPKN